MSCIRALCGLGFVVTAIAAWTGFAWLLMLAFLFLGIAILELDEIR